jgi:hypothetical protein
MPPQQVDDIQRSLGKLEGQLDMLIESHNSLKQEVFKLLANHQRDIDILKDSRSRLIGIAMTASIFLTIAVDWVKHKILP